MFDTIASISTAISSSGIGIIRISGPDALDVIAKVFHPMADKDIRKVASHTLHYGRIISEESGKPIDEVIVSVMKGPASYTKEDVVEVNCHGGVLVTRQVLNVVLMAGCRLAEPGEFTKRAFLNGRIDLSQAEAVMDIINAQTQLSLDASMHQLKGDLSDKIQRIKDGMLELIAHIEASIDYPEYDIDELSFDSVMDKIDGMSGDIKQLSESYDNGRIIKEGIRTVIIGKPNVGKSTLLNALLRDNRAIVTEIPGTTRDVLEEYMNIHGIPIRLMDTAGIRETEDIVEQIGVSKSKERLIEADLVIMVLDASRDLEDDDMEILGLIEDKEAIFLLNKIDLEEKIDRSMLERHVKDSRFIEVSAVNNKGIATLENAVRDMFLIGEIDMDNQVYITNARHKDALDKAAASLDEVNASISSGMPEDCWSIDLKNAYDSLSVVTGESVTEDLIDQIFSQFCLGK